MQKTDCKHEKVKMSQLYGKLRQKSKDGPYYYRITVANGQRREFALKTSDFNTACNKAADLDKVYFSPTPEVAIAQISAIRGFSKQAINLPLSEVWEKYSVHPFACDAQNRK